MASPLTEGRELKCVARHQRAFAVASPLAEGRELKFSLRQDYRLFRDRRPSRRGVNWRGCWLSGKKVSSRVFILCFRCKKTFRTLLTKPLE
mgnify:CR=1 FL=1